MIRQTHQMTNLIQEQTPRIPTLFFSPFFMIFFLLLVLNFISNFFVHGPLGRGVPKRGLTSACLVGTSRPNFINTKNGIVHLFWQYGSKLVLL